MNERLTYIDYGKTIAIFLVVLGHLKITENIYHFIYSFHMPFFFFISGVLFNNSLTLTNTIKKNINKLVIPYLWFSMLSFFTLPFITNIIELKNRSIGFTQFLYSGYEATIGSIYGSMTSLGSTWNSILWFLPCLFMIILLFKVLSPISVKILIPILIAIQFLVSIISQYINPILPYLRFPFGFDAALIGVLFFAIGFYSKNRILINSKYLSLFISFVSFLIVYYVSVNYKTSFDIANLNQGTLPILTYFVSLVGIYGLVSISNFLSLSFGKIKLIEIISNNTLYIFAFQFIIIWNLHRLEFIFPNIFYHLKFNIFIYSIIVLCLTLIMKVFVKKIFLYIYKVSHLVVFTHI